MTAKITVSEPYLLAYARLPLCIAHLSTALVTGSADPQAVAPLVCLLMECQCAARQCCIEYYPVKNAKMSIIFSN